MMNARYILGATVAVPLLPLMYYQGKQIRASVPVLPEATGIEGYCEVSSAREINLLTIGESTIAGVGVKTHREGFTGTLAQEIANQLGVNVRWKVYARSGYTAKRVTEKILPKITENEVDIIVVGLGGNDAFRLNRPAKWRKDIEKLVAELRLKFLEAPIVFTNMPPIKEFPAFTPLIKFTVGNLVEILGDELNQAIEPLPNVYYSSEKITLNSWIKKFSVDTETSEFFSDGVHPSLFTYQTWARDLADFILKDKKVLG
ncbi:MAG: SGNH/GDSL hydrolase family protein [Bacteroidota bacterium]